MNNTVTLQASDNVKNFGDFWTSLVIKIYNPSKGSSLTMYINNATTNYSTKKITLDKIGTNELAGYTTIQGVNIIYHCYCTRSLLINKLTTSQWCECSRLLLYQSLYKAQCCSVIPLQSLQAPNVYLAIVRVSLE